MPHLFSPALRFKAIESDLRADFVIAYSGNGKSDHPVL